MLSICVSRYYWLSGFTVDIPTGIAVHHYIRGFGVMMCSFFILRKKVLIMATNQANGTESPRINTIDWTAEYFYAESLRQMNTQRLSVGLPVISTTQGRKLHGEYMKKFHDMIAPGTNTYMAMYGPNAPTEPQARRNRISGQMMAAMAYSFSSTMSELNGGRSYYQLLKKDREANAQNEMSSETEAMVLGYEESKKRAYSIVTHFTGTTGWQLDMAEAYATEQAELVSNGARLPISPYDDRFSMKKSMLDNGGRILWANMNDMVSGAGTVMDVENANLFEELESPEGFPNGDFAYRCKLNHPDDVTGLSRLRPYMSDSDYKSVQARVAESDVKMSASALDKSVAILQWLTDNGYSYTISNDTNPGQLKARVGNSKLDIRIMDTPQNEDFIGRCYEEGYESYYLKSRDTGFSPNTQDVVKMISYVLGNTVERESYNSGELSNVKERSARGAMYVNKQRGVRREGDHVGRNAGEVAEVFAQMMRNPKGGAPIVKTVHQDGLMPFDSEKGTYPSSQVMMDVHLGQDMGSYTKRGYGVVSIRSSHHASHEYFDTNEQASNFLSDAITTARENYFEKLDIDRLMDEAVAHAGEPDYVPELSYDPEISPIQLQYWEVLSGKRELYKAGMTADEVHQDIEMEEEMSAAETALLDSIFGDSANGQYEGTVEEQVRQHIADTLDIEFGQLEPSAEDGLRFNPWNVAKFMTSSYGQFRNNDNVVEAMKQMEIPAEELRGNEFQVNQIKDKLVRFNPETARQMGSEDASPFMKTLAKTIQETVSTSHCIVNPEDIQIDDNGIVHYVAQRTILNNKGQDVTFEPVEGYIGQIFEPDADGVVETQFNGSPNQLFSPGYLAYVLPQADGESKTLPERVRLKGYLQVLQENIRRQLRHDLLDPHADVGTTTSVNNSYRGLYETRYKVHGEMEPGETLKDAYIRECQMTGLPEDAIHARFATFRGMVRLPSSFKDDSSLNAAFARSREGQAGVVDIMNDNARDAWQLSGGENISVLSEDWDGYTDKTATGSAKNQGVVRYLVEGAYVDENGAMHPSRNADGTINKEARTALMALPYMQYVDYTPFDRQQMVFSNLSGASAIDNHTGVAMMTMGGYTFDDGAVISAAWAEKNGPLGEDGIRRPIGVGDKILDCAGNKSIVGKVIDPDMDAEEFDKLDDMTKEMVTFFHDNPEVSVVMAPYSPMGRFNATTAKFAINDNFEINLPDGSVTYGGYMPMIVTDKTVDEKTKEYGDDAVKAGGGRSASGQFNWILSAVGAYSLMDECYGNNESSLANYREYLITMGMDIDETATLKMGYHPQGDEKRHYFMLPEAGELESLTRKSAAEMFKGAVDNRGGFLEIPVQITLPSGEKLKPVDAEKSAYGNAGVETFALPIMSSYLRSGQEFQDGTSMSHDYTNHYAQIYAASVEYLNAKSRVFEYNPDLKDKNGKPVTEAAQLKDFEKQRDTVLRRSEARINSEYKEITSDVEARIFTGKHNYVRDHLMSARLPHSATAVWTAEPNCAIDEVRMPSSMAKTLGKKEGESVLLWRDPCLHTSNLAGMRVVIDDSLTGVAVNPLMAARMDGDFDGDSVGIYGVSSRAGLKDLNDRLAIHNTLLDVTHRDAETGNYALFINTKMDVQSLYARDEEERAKAAAEGHPMEGKSLRERFAEMEHRANDIYQGRGEFAGLTDEEKDLANRTLCNELSDWSHELFESHVIGAQTLSMESPAAYLKDLQKIADTKAKGKAANIKDVAKYYGMTYDTKEDGSIDYDSVKVYDNTLATRQDMKNTEYAVAVKANGTPLGGQVSLNLAEVCRNLCLKDGLDLTYNATQAVLQAKHDPVMAKQQYGMLQDALKSMWRGHKLESRMVPVFEDELDANGKQVPVLNEDGKQKYRQTWTEVRDERNKPVALTTSQWVNQFMEIHESKDGMNLAGDVNREQVEKVARALTSPDGTVYNIEDDKVRQILATPMDRLAYQPSLAATVEAAKNNECMFAGAANEHLAPKLIRENIAQVRAYEAQKLAMPQQQAGGIRFDRSDESVAKDAGPQLKGFGKSDVLEGETKRPETRYQTSDKYVGENHKGIGNVVVGKYHAPEERKLSDVLKEMLPEDEAPTASDYVNMGVGTDEAALSDAALAYQDRDDIDDMRDVVEDDVKSAEKDALAMALAEKASCEMSREAGVASSKPVDAASKEAHIHEIANTVTSDKESSNDTPNP